MSSVLWAPCWTGRSSLKPDFHKPQLHVRTEREKKIPDPVMVDLLKKVIGGRHRSLRFRARGTSMAPFIKDNDVITVSPAEAGKLNVGQVIAFSFQPEEKLCVHRIIGKEENGFVTRGDNLGSPDGLILFEQVLGLVTMVERNGRIIKTGKGFGKNWIVRFWHGKIRQGVTARWMQLKTARGKAAHGK